MNVSAFNSESITNLLTLKSAEAKSESNPVESFSDVLKNAFFKVSDLQNKSDSMVQQMITNPGKVNVHDVTALMSQSEMALSFTKAVTDRVINAYREVTNLR